MNKRTRGVWLALGLVLVWRLALLIFTAQPIPSEDAYFFDGAVVNWLQHGHYFNPSLAEAFPISGHQVYAAYPPLYQAALVLWMTAFGPSALTTMSLHVALFSAAGILVVTLLRQVFPMVPRSPLAVLFLLGVTFNDRPEDLAHIFGLTALLLTSLRLCGKVGGFAAAAGITVALLAALYTSPVVGAFYYGAAFLTDAAAWWFARQRFLAGAFVAVVILLAGITLFIARSYPLLWNGFLENSRQTPMLANGFRTPTLNEIIKLIRTGPVFLLALGSLPFLLRRREQLSAGLGEDLPWLSLTAGVTAMGGIMLTAAMLLLSPNYVAYVLYVQVLLAAGLLVLARRWYPNGGRRLLPVAVTVCLVLVSVRAVGMTTWGALCARDIGYRDAHEILREQLQPYVASGGRVVVSSAFLYGTAEMGLDEAIHSVWTFDRRFYTDQADFEALVRLRPPKLVLTQFDFHRSYARVLDQLRQHPELVTVTVQDTARVRPPDASPALQRVVQHISWAPVVVDLKWQR